MPAEKYILPDRAAWLAARKNHIGGSDAAACVGRSPHKDNVQLWEEKMGLVIPADISDKEYVWYGTEAEKYLRGLFALDFPEYQVLYDENNMFLNPDFPWMHASTGSLDSGTCCSRHKGPGIPGSPGQRVREDTSLPQCRTRHIPYPKYLPESPVPSSLPRAARYPCAGSSPHTPRHPIRRCGSSSQRARRPGREVCTSRRALDLLSF